MWDTEVVVTPDIEPVRGPLAGLRVALVHDYLNQPGGAEKVVEVLCRMFPAAPVYTSVYDREAMGPFWRDIDVRTSFMQRLSPRLGTARALLPLYPTAFESFDLSGYDLVLSSSSAFAKGVITRPETLHVSYCYTPTRFLWMYQEYTGRQILPPLARTVLPALMTPLRVWDLAAAARVDRFITISEAVRRRVEKYYRCSSVVVPPPVEVTRFSPSDGGVDGYFLVVARLQSYKRVDLAIEACNRLGVELRIAGDGPDRGRLQRLAGPTVEFLGRVEDAEVSRLLSRCRALLWPGEEDFGLVPVEAQASGRPVVAYRAGGALETVVEGETGIFFDHQDAQDLAQTLRSFDPAGYDPAVLRRNAERFDVPHFVDRMVDELERAHGELKDDATRARGGVSRGFAGHA